MRFGAGRAWSEADARVPAVSMMMSVLVLV